MCTILGSVSYATDGGRIGITSDASAIVPTSLLQIVNKAISTGLRVSSTWTGSAAQPYQNNDNSLWETFNRTVDNSLNLSWSISAPNAYNDIPEGVRDAGERVGIYGWATSVNIADTFVHAGTLASQIGVRGRAGFQGADHPSTAVIENARGVRGEIFSESVGTVIQNAFAGDFRSENANGTILNNIAVYASAATGTNANYSFFGNQGRLFNRNQVLVGDLTSQSSSRLASRGTGNSFEFGHPSGDGYGSNIGATYSSGTPFIALCAEADATGNTFTTRGRRGTVIFNDLNGSIVISRVGNANAVGQTPSESARFDADGRLMLANVPTYSDDATAVAGGLQPTHVYKTSDGQLRIVL